VRNLTNGKTVHLRTDSDAFIEEIRVLTGAGHGIKIRAELTALAQSFPEDGWDTTEKRLGAAGGVSGWAPLPRVLPPTARVRRGGDGRARPEVRCGVSDSRRRSASRGSRSGTGTLQTLSVWSLGCQTIGPYLVTHEYLRGIPRYGPRCPGNPAGRRTAAHG